MFIKDRDGFESQFKACKLNTVQRLGVQTRLSHVRDAEVVVRALQL